jgi:hypothetical protein
MGIGNKERIQLFEISETVDFIDSKLLTDIQRRSSSYAAACSVHLPYAACMSHTAGVLSVQPCTEIRIKDRNVLRTGSCERNNQQKEE